MKKVVKFGLFEYSTENIGDEIQSIAASRFLPRIDYYFNRDNIDATKTNPKDEIKLIMNGWYTHHPENWPPKNPAIKPLLIAMHIEQDALEGKPKEAFLSQKSREFLLRNGPVGARNYPTKELLDESGIPSYFSGCVTLTLNKDSAIKKQNYILAVDVPDDVYQTMKKNTKRPILRLDTSRKESLDRDTKFLLAKLWLYLYQSAHAVVTTRLHTMLPCLALETPVLAITGRDPKRYQGLVELTNNATAKEYIKKPSLYPLDTPPLNPDKYKDLRKRIEKTCSDYTGFDSNKSFLGESTINDIVNNPSLIQFFLDSTNETWLLEKAHNQIADLQNQIKELQNKIGALEHPGIKNSSKTLLREIKRSLR